MSAIPTHERLEQTPLPRLLIDLYRARFGGAITLSRDKIAKRFLFQEGVPIFAESTLPSESLGVHLMDTGKITREDYSRVVAQVQQHGGKEGKALLELGLLDARGLFLALKEQVRMRVVECFGWPHGEFYVDSENAPSQDAQPFRSDLYALIQEGIETHWSVDRTLRDLGPHMQHFPLRTDGFERVSARLRCDEAVTALLGALDGTLTLWKAVQLAKTPRALAAAWVLDAAGALDYRDEPLAPRGPLAPDEPPELEILVSDDAKRTDATPRTQAGGARAQRAREGAARAAGERSPEKLAAEILAKHERLDSADHYELLGVESDAPAAAIKRVYLLAARTYHPDALARSGLDDATRALASQVFAEIGKAYTVLSDPAKRADYDARLEGGDPDLDMNALAQAETLYRKGEFLLRQGNFRGALEFLEPAVDLWPDDGAYRSSLGWALYKKMPSEPERAREHLERAAELEPNDGVALFRLSVVLRAFGETERSASLARRASQLDPTVG